MPPKGRDSPNNEPQSVIHVPIGFKTFEGDGISYGSPTQRSDDTTRLASPTTPEAAVVGPEDKVGNYTVVRADCIG